MATCGISFASRVCIWLPRLKIFVYGAQVCALRYLAVPVFPVTSQGTASTGGYDFAA